MIPEVAGLAPAPGTPCWIDLAATDEEAARAFYTGLFGWSYYSRPDPATGSYTIATIDGIAVAGIYQSVRNQLPAWNLHLAVANADSAAEWVQSLGGRIILAPVEIPGRGVIVHAQDPAGATFVLWQTPDDWEFGTRAPGMFSGTDLHTHDGAAADAFYCRLFALTSHQIGFGENVDYAEWRLDPALRSEMTAEWGHEPSEAVLHRYVMGPEFPRNTPAHWLSYLTVDPRIGTDATASRALSLGGAIATVPFDTEYGRTAVLIDPCGAPFGVIDRARPVEDWRRSEVDDPDEE